MRTSPRDSYTKVVDIWAVGAVTHEILTAEIPFLDRHQDLDSMATTQHSEQYTASDFGVEVDSELLYNYCHGSEFPSERLEEHGVSEEGIDFVKSLMAANPRDRVSATDALKSLWLTGPGR